MAHPPARYRNDLMDSARWQEISLRPGDIVISTPPKCGTTWMQMICALLVFQTPELPRPLAAMSPWVDVLTSSRAELRSEYESQSHRRFLKTHTPLDGLPFDDRVTYLCVGRDPRDVAISWDHHLRNLDLDTFKALRQRAATTDGQAEQPLAGAATQAPPASAYDRFLAWVDDPTPMSGLGWTVDHLASFWRERHRPNVLLLHYDDLLADLDAQMRALAARLGVEVAEHRWGELVPAATFDRMRSRPDAFAPQNRIWRDPSQFFRSGVSGQWRGLLDPAGLARYRARVNELAGPELVSWLHRGPITS